MKITKSECKLTHPTFEVPSYLEFFDIEDWENDEKTLVFRLPLNSEINQETYLDFIDFVGNAGASEFFTRKSEGKIYCRMYAKWWCEY